MTFEIQKLYGFSGDKASIYTLYCIDNDETSLNKFISENASKFPDEIKFIVSNLQTIGHKTGAREQFFKSKEGNPGDGIEALFDTPYSNLRLYCIRNGMVNVIIGGGGEKPKNIRALQENDKLKDENYFLRAVAKLFIERIKTKEIRYSPDGMDLEGNLKFEDTDLLQ